MIEALVRRSECVPYSSRRKPMPVTHSSTRRAYCRGRRLGPGKRRAPFFLATKADAGDPLVHETGILPCAQVLSLIYTAGEHEVIAAASPSFEPCEHAGSCRLKEFELHWPTGLLHDDGSGA